ncbi:unnamed protein product [Meloidogyne enterolobii]|uniref:Uncharacterized protein n=1 Tax=Meloidogyne enterolobii TaxID=390850 RepID=A0ACB1A033_MELEN
MKNKNFKISAELISEIVAYIHFHHKWGKIRVSKLFDLLVIKFHKKFITEMKITKQAIGEALSKILGYFVYLSSNQMKKLKMGDEVHNTGPFDSIFVVLRDFAGEAPFLGELLNTILQLPQSPQGAWPEWPTKYFTDPKGGWDGINKAKISILKLLFGQFVEFYKLSNDNFTLTFLPRILQLLKGILSNLRRLFGVKEEDVKSVNWDDYNDGDDGTGPSTSGTGPGTSGDGAKPPKIRRIK